MKNRCVLFFAGILMMMTLLGCGSKYHLHFDGYGLTSPKTAYADGEPVTVYYDMIATDTEYSFYLDEPDVELEQDFDGEHGYVLKFNMPAHDVTVTVESRNSMEYVPEPDIQPERESISEEVVWEKPSEPEDKDAEWKKAYLEIFEDTKLPIEDKEWRPRASFIYLDDDDIPEMFIVYNYEDQPQTEFTYPPLDEGGKLYSFVDGSAVEVCTATVSCIPGQGLYFAGFYEGSDGTGTEKIGKWDGKTTEWIWEGLHDFVEDETGYYINGKEVTWEEYSADIKRYYDDSQADFGDCMKYDEVIEFLCEG